VSWGWRLEAADGSALSTVGTATHVPVHQSQSDAESWLGEHWRELAEQGVAQVSLLHGSAVHYGPMSLSDA
jgi:hypothetical protein